MNEETSILLTYSLFSTKVPGHNFFLRFFSLIHHVAIIEVIRQN